MGARDLNSDPHAFVTNTLLIGPSPQSSRLAHFQTFLEEVGEQRGGWKDGSMTESTGSSRPHAQHTPQMTPPATAAGAQHPLLVSMSNVHAVHRHT